MLIHSHTHIRVNTHTHYTQVYTRTLCKEIHIEERPANELTRVNACQKHIPMFTHTYIHAHVHPYTYLYTQIYMHTHTHTHTYTYRYTHTYTYRYTHTFKEIHIAERPAKELTIHTHMQGNPHRTSS